MCTLTERLENVDNTNETSYKTTTIKQELQTRTTKTENLERLSCDMKDNVLDSISGKVWIKIPFDGWESMVRSPHCGTTYYFKLTHPH